MGHREHARILNAVDDSLVAAKRADSETTANPASCALRFMTEHSYSGRDFWQALFRDDDTCGSYARPIVSGEEFALENAVHFRRLFPLWFDSMNLGDILHKEQIITELQASNRWEAIDELINNLVSCGKIKAEHQQAIAAVVKKRETSMSTGIGFGIGIPHASTDLIYEVVGALGRSRKGVNFDALDNQPVNLVMLFLVPQGQFQKHLHTLANIAKLLHKKEFRQALEEAPNAETMCRIIKETSAGK
jgi:fructose-specific phosphotransferase system IIA component